MSWLWKFLARKILPIVLGEIIKEIESGEKKKDVDGS